MPLPKQPTLANRLKKKIAGQPLYIPAASMKIRPETLGAIVRGQEPKQRRIIEALENFLNN